MSAPTTRYLISTMSITLAVFLLSAPVFAGTAGLRIKCARSATIYLNGKESGQCPKNLTLTSGSYEVVLKQSVDEDTLYYYKQTMDLASDAIETVDANLVLTYTEVGLRKEQEKKAREELAKQEQERQAREDQARRDRQEQERKAREVALNLEQEKKVLAELENGEAMVLVKGGEYEMGDTFGDGDKDEKPVHTVRVGDFYIGKYEVTQGLWQAVMGSNPSKYQKGSIYPVTNVSWDDVQEFIKKLNDKTAKHYRLPTEAEWEYAARSGGKMEKFAGGDDVDSLAWYDKNSEKSIHPVGTKKANGIGICDMSGNVWEWVQDCYHMDYAAAPGDGKEWESGWLRSECEKTNDKKDSVRVLRGGSGSVAPVGVRAAGRGRNAPTGCGDAAGFRLALSTVQ